jgi:hypothetical protein
MAEITQFMVVAFDYADNGIVAGEPSDVCFTPDSGHRRRGLGQCPNSNF